MKYLLCFLLSCITLFVSSQNQIIRKLISEDKYKEASQLLSKELAKRPNDAELNFLKWKAAYYGGENAKENFKYLNKAIEIDPKFSEAYIARGLFFIRLLRFEDGRDDIEEAMKYVSNDTIRRDALMAMGSYYMSTRQQEKSMEMNLKVLESDSVYIPALNNLALNYQDLGKNEEALEVLCKIEKLDPKANYITINIGFVLNNLKRYNEAITYFDKAEKIKKEALVYSNRAFAKYNLQQYAGALSDINQSIKMFPSNSYAYMVRAKIYMDKGEKEKACTDLNTSLFYKYTEMYGDEVKELRDKHCIK